MNGSQSEGQAKRQAVNRHDVLSTEPAYSSSEVGKATGISSSTVRKYSITLEERGYNILRDEHNRRIYVDSDIQIIRDMIAYTKRGVTVINAAKAVISERHARQEQAVSVQNENEIINNSEVVEQLVEYMERQDEHITRQEAQINALNVKVDNLIEIIKDRDALEDKSEDKNLQDRDQVLMQTLNEMLEVRKQLSTIKENENLKEEEVKEVEKKKGFFRRFINLFK